MQGVVFLGEKELELRDFPDPEPGPGEVVLEIKASGMCGSDPIKILSGQENLSAIGDTEEEALEDICELKPGECRLACVAKVTGPVEFEIIEQ